MNAETLFRVHEEKRGNVAHADSSSMNDPKPSLHVNPIGGNWEVESEAGTLGQAETKSEAEELAATLAREVGANNVAVHTSDGLVEKDIPVAAPKNPGASSE